MKKIVLTAGVLLAQLLAVNAFAAGEVDADQSKAAASTPVTAQEKHEARAARKATGAAVAKSEKAAGEAATADDSATASKKATAAEKKAARAKRKAAGAAAAKEQQNGQ